MGDVAGVYSDHMVHCLKESQRLAMVFPTLRVWQWVGYL